MHNMKKSSKKMRKIIAPAILAAIAMIIATTNAAHVIAVDYIDVPYTTNQNLILIDFDDEWGIKELKVVRDNAYYRNRLPYRGAFALQDNIMEDEYPIYIELIGYGDELMEGYGEDVLHSAETYSETIFILYFEGIAKIRVYDTYHDLYDVLVESSINFCNGNGICEPCKEGICLVNENFATCADCGSGSSDLYCDLKKDGICDPDCNNLDMDCSGCYEGKCYYEDSLDMMNVCDELGGEVCPTFEECAGTVTSSNENGYCCSGNCVDPTVDEEYMEAEPVEVEFTGASEFIDELLAPVDIAEYETEKIYCLDVGEAVCIESERCTGENVYSDDAGYDCCTEGCVPLAEEELKRPYEEIFEEVPEEVALPEEVTEGFALPEIKKTSLWWLLLLAIPAVIAVFVFMGLKKKRAKREKRIEYEYGYYKKYGYNEGQLKKILGNRGWKKDEIRKVMKK